MDECIELVASALKALGRGQADMPLRFGYRLPLPEAEKRVGILASMPSYIETAAGQRYCANKVITVFPDNAKHGHHSHQGAILLFEARHGRLAAIVDAAEVTAVRTAAASAVATRLLARAGARTLALLGAGVQARAHATAMLLARPALRRVVVWSRTAERAAALAGWLRGEHPALDVAVADTAQEAVANADIVCTLTPASAPVLRGAWLKVGAHVNAVGACTPAHRELDEECVTRAVLFADRRESCLQEPGDVVVPLREGAIDASHIRAELGELLLGTHAGRESEEQITLFESLGLAVQDLVAAMHVLRRYEEEAQGRGPQRQGGEGGSGGAPGAVRVALNPA
eukprot:g406.t1